MTASYRTIRPHFLSNTFVPTGTVITEGGGLIPVGWSPTLAVDPLNAQAVANFYAAGPRNACNEDLSLFAVDNYWNQGASPFIQPTTYWVKNFPSNLWSLTGLGSSYPAVGAS